MNEQSRAYRQMQAPSTAEVAHLDGTGCNGAGFRSQRNGRWREDSKLRWICPVVEHQGAVLLQGPYLHPEEVGRYKLTRPVCSSVDAKEEDCDILLHAENGKTFICAQCVKGVTALLKANPGRKHLRYFAERQQQNRRKGMTPTERRQEPVRHYGRGRGRH